MYDMSAQTGVKNKRIFGRKLWTM